MKLIYRIIYVYGSLCLIILGHELWHYFECGGSFVAGVGYFKGEFITGATWCANGDSGEFIPYTISLLLFLLFAYILKRRG